MGHNGGMYLAEPKTGDYLILAVFLSPVQAEVARLTMMPHRYRREIIGAQFIGEKFHPLSLSGTEDMITRLAIDQIPSCVYTYQKDKESYSQWLKLQHP